MLEEVRKTPGQPKLYSILYSGVDVPPDVEVCAARLREVAPIEPAAPVCVTPIIGAHFGPLGLGIVVVNE
jgi:hypothetical protein